MRWQLAAAAATFGVGVLISVATGDLAGGLYGLLLALLMLAVLDGRRD